jgi:hypothetical protein
MRITIRPILDPRREVDLTHRLTAAIAEELWMLYGGNSQLNWLEAEMHLARIATPGEAGGAAAHGAAAPRCPARPAARSGNEPIAPAAPTGAFEQHARRAHRQDKGTWLQSNHGLRTWLDTVAGLPRRSAAASGPVRGVAARGTSRMRHGRRRS